MYALSGKEMQENLADVYVIVGENEKALDRLEPLLKIPYTLSPSWLKIDPTYAPPYAGLADCYELLGSAPYSTLMPKDAFPKSEV